MRLLLIEDDEMLGKAVRAGLKQDGYTVDWLTDGEAGLQALGSDDFDVVVLDIGLPGMSGIEVLQRLRKQKKTLPVMILTAYDAVSDRITGLDAGADDYLIKPFDLDELLARLRAITRRREGRAQSRIELGSIQLDTAAHRLVIHGEEVSLSNKEYQLLEYLLTHAGNVIPRDRLESILYGWEGGVESNSLEVYIHNLRKKVGPGTIKTIRGVGYRLEQPAH
ncbi:response regulator transcription factor [Thiohalophilus sp.]|uniref:response regulator transcription factor n=1 Tax=Thiohalophilus sp. TaxID=3028392 RepID=UPI002ACF0379|nr:response regulator transcription factor [Thiohalophilus sp.]MDZ7803272.1 response regulator transcription factor [Thiohalophilus sp.]